MDIEKFIPERIDELCKRNRISRYQLSALTGISQSALSAIVKKKIIPTLITLNKICKGLGISMSEFFKNRDRGGHGNISEDQ